MPDIKTYSNGFVPSRTLSGSGDSATQRFAKDATATGADARIAVGDPVVLTSNGTVKKMLVATGDTGAALGVVANVVDAAGKPKERRTTQSSKVSLSAETTDQFDVIVGTDMVYRVVTDLSAMTTVSAQKYIGELGTVAFVSADANDDKLGKTTTVLDITTSAGAAFKVVGVPNIVGGTNQEFEVVINNGVFKGNTSGV